MQIELYKSLSLGTKNSYVYLFKQLIDWSNTALDKATAISDVVEALRRKGYTVTKND